MFVFVIVCGVFFNFSFAVFFFVCVCDLEALRKSFSLLTDCPS